MNPSILLIGIPTLCYLGQAIYSATRGDWSTATVFTGYAFANLGLLYRA